MALKSCRDCGEQVSSRSDKCPKCGCPTKGFADYAVGCLVIIVAIAAMIVWIGKKAAELPTPDRFEQTQD